jgi:hypothetical protein
MRNASRPSEREGFSRAVCGQVVLTRVEGLFSNPSVGSPRRFCPPACRVAAHRRRQAGIPENTPLQRTGGRNRRLGAPEEGEARAIASAPTHRVVIWEISLIDPGEIPKSPA